MILGSGRVSLGVLQECVTCYNAKPLGFAKQLGGFARHSRLHLWLSKRWAQRIIVCYKVPGGLRPTHAQLNPRRLPHTKVLRPIIPDAERLASARVLLLPTCLWCNPARWNDCINTHTATHNILVSTHRPRHCVPAATPASAATPQQLETLYTLHILQHCSTQGP